MHHGTTSWPEQGRACCPCRSRDRRHEGSVEQLRAPCRQDVVPFHLYRLLRRPDRQVPYPGGTRPFGVPAPKDEIIRRTVVRPTASQRRRVAIRLLRTSLGYGERLDQPSRLPCDLPPE